MAAQGAGLGGYGATAYRRAQGLVLQPRGRAHAPVVYLEGSTVTSIASCEPRETWVENADPGRDWPTGGDCAPLP